MADDFYVGQANPETRASDYNVLDFVISQKIKDLATSMPVQVVAVSGGGLDSIGYVDIQPLVQLIAGEDSPMNRGVIPNVPYFRYQGGVNAIIIDPKVGDVGIAVFSSRDISTVKSANKLTDVSRLAPPGSRRQYDFSDAMYIGGLLNAIPTRYIQFTDTGIIIEANDQLTINSNVSINGDLTISGTTKTGGNINLNTHHHSDPQGGNTGGPIS
jgi:hypothetical protein